MHAFALSFRVGSVVTAGVVLWLALIVLSSSWATHVSHAQSPSGVEGLLPGDSSIPDAPLRDAGTTTPEAGSGREPEAQAPDQSFEGSFQPAIPGRGLTQDWQGPATGPWSSWSADGFRSVPIRTFSNGSRLRFTQHTTGWSSEGWAVREDILNDAIGESASTRIALQWQQRLGRRFELRLEVGAGTGMDATGETRLQLGTSAALVWWFSRNWGLALQAGWMLQSPAVFGREDRIDYRQEFENETPWDDRQTPDVGEALNRFFWGLTPVHRH
jgi:hypothetical protein